jgi:hypothetical protein
MTNNTNYPENTPARLRHLFDMRDRAVEACADLDHSRRDLQERHIGTSAIERAQACMLAAGDTLDEVADYLDNKIAKALAP